MLKHVLAILSLCFASNTSFAIEKAPSERFDALTKEIRCVVCQNQSIADSNAPLAKDLRHKIDAMIQDHKTDAEITDYLVKRYGEFILLRPRFNKVTGLLWVFPFIALSSVLIVIMVFLIRSYRAKEPK